MTKLIFRSHGLGDIMTEPKEQSLKEQYAEALAKVTHYKNEYAIFGNKETKAAKQKLAQIQKWNAVALGLEGHQGGVHLSSTCIKRILKTYANQVHKRQQSIRSKYLEKGNAREEDAITLLSRVTKKMYTKNEERLFNAYITGIVDVFQGPEIRKAKHTLDTKCSWSYDTFLEAFFAALNSDYEWQGHGYMDLTGAEMHTVCYCLVNGLLKALNDELFRVAKEMEVIDASHETDPVFKEACQQVERNFIFDVNAFYQEYPFYEFANPVRLIKGVCYWDFDIPLEKRLHQKTFERDNDKIRRIHERVNQCNEWAQQNLFKPGR
jgi:hypothetical protein